jgi:hypothetical protein
VRPQRIGLEHQAQVAVFGRLFQARAPSNTRRSPMSMVPALRAFQAGHRAQQRGLAAARRPQQRHHFAALQVHRHALQDRVGAAPVP